MSTQPQAVAEAQADWSKTADALKKAFERTRATVFALSIAAALFAAISSQIDNNPRKVLAGISTVCMVVGTFLTSRFLTAEHSRAWVRARAASEALKREWYKHAMKAAPYDTAANPDDVLQTEKNRIETEVDDLIGSRKTGTANLPATLSEDQYVKQRVVGQIDWHEKKATLAQEAAARMRGVEFTFAIATAVLTALIGLFEKYKFVSWIDLVALTGVLTTLSGAIVAYVEASRYDFIVQSYRSTARRLKDALSRQPKASPAGTAAWSDFVNGAETILQEQNNSWIAKFSKT
jgi:hypothetical protein